MPLEDKQSGRSPDSGCSKPECEEAGAKPASPNLHALSFGPECKGSLQIVLGDPGAVPGLDGHWGSACVTAPHQARRGDSQPSTQYSIRYPSMPPAPIFSGGRHLRVAVVSVTSSTVRCCGSLVGAVRFQGKGVELMRAQGSELESLVRKGINMVTQRSASKDVALLVLGNGIQGS